MTNQTRNEVLLEGIPVGAPEPSHENHGQLFYRQILEVPRLSGTADRLPLLVRQTQLPLLKEGVPLRVEGQLRSFNNRSGLGRRLVLTVYARSLQPGLGEPVNRILLAGTLCKPPIYRRTPLSRAPELRPGGLPAGDRVGTGGVTGVYLGGGSALVP